MPRLTTRKIEDYNRLAGATKHILKLGAEIAIKREEESLQMRLSQNGQNMETRIAELWKALNYRPAKTRMHGDLFFPEMAFKDKPVVHTMSIYKQTNLMTLKPKLKIHSTINLEIRPPARSAFTSCDVMPIDKINYSIETLGLVATNIDQLIKTFTRYTADIGDFIFKHLEGWPASVEAARRKFGAAENFKLWFHIEAQRNYEVVPRAGTEDTLMRDSYAFDIRPPASEDPDEAPEQLHELYGEIFGDEFYVKCMKRHLQHFASPTV